MPRPPTPRRPPGWRTPARSPSPSCPRSTTRAPAGVFIRVGGSIAMTQRIGYGDPDPTTGAVTNPSGWQLSVTSTDPVVLEILAAANGFVRASGTDSSFSVALERPDDVSGSWVIGPAQGSHVEIQHAKISATVNQSGPDAVLDVGAESDHVIVNIKLGSDSFLSAVLPPSLRLDSKIGLGVNTQTGFYLNGGVALVVDLPVNLTLDAGGVIGMTLQALHLRIGFTEPDQQTTDPDSASFTVGFTVDASVQVAGGVFKATVAGIGMAFALKQLTGDPTGATGTTAGRWQPGLDFVPPNGIGVASTPPRSPAGGSSATTRRAANTPAPCSSTSASVRSRSTSPRSPCSTPRSRATTATGRCSSSWPCSSRRHPARLRLHPLRRRRHPRHQPHHRQRRHRSRAADQGPRRDPVPARPDRPGAAHLRGLAPDHADLGRAHRGRADVPVLLGHRQPLHARARRPDRARPQPGPDRAARQLPVRRAQHRRPAGPAARRHHRCADLRPGRLHAPGGAGQQQARHLHDQRRAGPGRSWRRRRHLRALDRRLPPAVHPARERACARPDPGRHQRHRQPAPPARGLPRDHQPVVPVRGPGRAARRRRAARPRRLARARRPHPVACRTSGSAPRSRPGSPCRTTAVRCSRCPSTCCSRGPGLGTSRVRPP